MNRSLVFAYPGRLDLNTGGYAYDRRIIAGLSELGWEVQMLALGKGFPVPSAEVKCEAERGLSALPDGTLVFIDGLAFGVLDDWAGRSADRLRIVALVHHPLALETGLDAEQQTRFKHQERLALTYACRIVVTSPATARELLDQYRVEPGKLTVAIPGTEPAPISPGGGDPPHIVSIGTLTRRKGHDVLLPALKMVEDLQWTATIVGSRDLDPSIATALEQQLDRLRLSDRVVLAGECADSRLVLATADIFALASRYEGYGMVFAEALSQGLPIIACHAGAIPDVVPDDAGMLVPVDDVAAFSHALRRLLEDPAERRRYAQAALAAGSKLPGWEITARTISTALEACA